MGVLNTNIRAMLGMMTERERRLFMDDISERQDTQKFFKTIESLSSLEPIHKDGFKGDLFGLIGDQWERVLGFHPASKIKEIRKALEHSNEMLSNCTRSVAEAYGELHDLAHKPSSSKELYERSLGLRVAKEFYAFVQLAHSMVDLGRRYKKAKSELIDPEKVKNAYYAYLGGSYDDTLNQGFIKDMRNNLAHFMMHLPSWRINRDYETGTSSQYIFSPNSLLINGKWKIDDVKQWRRSEPDIDCYTQMLTYFTATNNFVSKLVSFDEKNRSKEEVHLDQCLLYREGLHNRASLGLWKQVLQNKPDLNPYDYLEKYFSKNEIRLIESKTHRSKEQADLMIEIGDKWGVMNDYYREMIYDMLKIDL